MGVHMGSPGHCAPGIVVINKVNAEVNTELPRSSIAYDEM